MKVPVGERERENRQSEGRKADLAKRERGSSCANEIAHNSHHAVNS